MACQADLAPHWGAHVVVAFMAFVAWAMRIECVAMAKVRARTGAFVRALAVELP